MKKVKNDYYLIRIHQSTLGTSNWWLSVIVQEKNTGNVYILGDYQYSQLMLFMDYRNNETDSYKHSEYLSMSGNKFFKKEIEKKKVASQEEIELFIEHLTDREKIKQKIKENLRETKLNILL